MWVGNWHGSVGCVGSVGSVWSVVCVGSVRCVAACASSVGRRLVGAVASSDRRAGGHSLLLSANWTKIIVAFVKSEICPTLSYSLQIGSNNCQTISF